MPAQEGAGRDALNDVARAVVDVDAASEIENDDISSREERTGSLTGTKDLTRMDIRVDAPQHHPDSPGAHLSGGGRGSLGGDKIAPAGVPRWIREAVDGMALRPVGDGDLPSDGGRGGFTAKVGPTKADGDRTPRRIPVGTPIVQLYTAVRDNLSFRRESRRGSRGEVDVSRVRGRDDDMVSRGGVGQVESAGRHRPVAGRGELDLVGTVTRTHGGIGLARTV